MTIDFSSNLPRCRRTEKSPCSCAQMADVFCPLLRGEVTEYTAEIRANLRSAADPGCWICKGVGLHDEIPEPPAGEKLYLTTDTGLRLLALLGLPAEPSGECTIAEARRGLLRARAVTLDTFVRAEKRDYGKPCRDDDGTIELRPIRFQSKGMDEAGLLDRVNQFEAFIQTVAKQGAQAILWG